MIYEILRGSGAQFTFVTAARARRGRGILFALAPAVGLSMALSILFAVSPDKIFLWQVIRQLFLPGIAIAACLSVLGFVLGHRVRERIEATAQGLRIVRTPAIGRPRVISRSQEELTLFAIKPNVRSLGADILLVAHCRDGTMIPVAEGEPHGGQMHGIAREVAALMDVPLQPASVQTQ
jgi:hypothetical protein